MTDPAVAEVVLGRYELGEVLGQGGSATVHRAWDRHTGRAVALKRFAPGADGPDRRRQRLEVRTLARLDHPGLVRLLDAGTEDGRSHLVMDLVEGPSLDRRLAHGCLPVPEVVALGAALAEALVVIHAQGITHRDVKPANVLLDPLHGPRLADFGVARLVDATRVTATDAVVGTAVYMAPEQLRGTAVGPAADVYALGLVLLEAATGDLGLPGTGFETVLTRLNVAPRVPADLPAALRTLLMTMTDGSPARRPSARQVAAALHSAEDEFSAAAPPTAPPTATIASPGRSGVRSTARRRGLAVVAAGLLVIVAAVLAIVLGRTSDPVPATPAVVTLPSVGAPSSAPGPAAVAAPVAGAEPAPATVAALVDPAPADRRAITPSRTPRPNPAAAPASRRVAEDHHGGGDDDGGNSRNSGHGGGGGRHDGGEG